MGSRYCNAAFTKLQQTSRKNLDLRSETTLFNSKNCPRSRWLLVILLSVVMRTQSFEDYFRFHWVWTSLKPALYLKTQSTLSRELKVTDGSLHVWYEVLYWFCQVKPVNGAASRLVKSLKHVTRKVSEIILISITPAKYFLYTNISFIYSTNTMQGFN